MLALEEDTIPDDLWDRLEVEYNLAIYGYVLYIPHLKEFNNATEEVTASEKESRSRGFYPTRRQPKDH